MSNPIPQYTPIDEMMIACTDDTGTAQNVSPFNQSMGALGCASLSNYTDPQYWTPGWSVFLNTTPQGGPLTYTSSNGGLVLGISLPPYWTISSTAGQLTALYPTCFLYATRKNCGTGISYAGDQIDYWRNPTTYSTIPTDTRTCDDIKYTTSSVNRYSQLDDIYTLLKDPFNKTKHTSPLTTIVGRSIDVYTDETFYVPKIKITYIKRPRRISNTTGSTVACELAEHTHQEVVDMAIANILEGIADPRYQTFRTEEIRSE